MYKGYLHTLFFILLFQVLDAHVFDTLFSIPQEERIDVSGRILNEHLFPLDSAESARILFQFKKEAEENNDYFTKAIALTLIGIHTGARSYVDREKGLDYMKQALQIAEKQNYTILQAKIYHQMGFCLFSMQRPEDGLFALLNSNRIMRKAGYDNVSYLTSYLTDIGAVYYDFGNFKKAIQFLFEILDYTDYDHDRMVVFARIGLSYQKMSVLDSARHYFQKALSIAEKNKDSLHIGMYLGNVGTVYLEQGRFDEALTLLKEDYAVCLKYAKRETGRKAVELYESAARSLISQAKIYVQKNNYEKAKEKITEAQEIIEKFRIDKREMKVSMYNLSAQIAAHYGDYDKAYASMDSSGTIREYLQQNFDRNMLANIEAQLVSQEHLADVELLEKEKYVQSVIRNAVIALAVLIILLFSSLLINLINKQKRRQRMYALEKQKAEEKMADFKKRIRDKNRLIESFERKFNEYLLEQNDAEENRGDMHQLYEQIILTDDDWIQFKRDFESAYPGFMQQLIIKHPELTPAEIRLLALIKLNLSSKEIAKTLGISPESVRKTRHRVMKKIGISDHKQLPVFVAEL